LNFESLKIVPDSEANLKVSASAGLWNFSVESDEGKKKAVRS
jgi:hypothetical protein